MSQSARSSSESIAVVVLAGGRSERFGADKTRAEVGGVSLLERVLGAAGGMRTPVDEVVVIGPWAPDGVRHVVEPQRFGGPLAALAFALGQVSAPQVLVLAADHPDLQPDLLTLLLDRLGAHPEAAVAVPLRAGRREPLVAAYRRSVGSLAHELLQQGERSMQSLLRAVTVVEVPEDQWRLVDPDGRSFFDIDRVEDLPDHES